MWSPNLSAKKKIKPNTEWHAIKINQLISLPFAKLNLSCHFLQLEDFPNHLWKCFNSLGVVMYVYIYLFQLKLSKLFLLLIFVFVLFSENWTETKMCSL